MTLFYNEIIEFIPVHSDYIFDADQAETTDFL